jgi:hypothetical protein
LKYPKHWEVELIIYIYEPTPWTFDEICFLIKKEVLTKDIPFTDAEGKRYVK